MKAEVDEFWGAIEFEGTTYDVQDGILEAETDVVEALSEKYGDKVVPVDETPTPEGEETGETETCEVVMTNGEVCGREKPCPYHD